MRRKSSWMGWTLIGALLSCVTCLAWGFATYLRFVRLEVEIADAASRVAAASRSRVALVDNLIGSPDAAHCLATDELTRLDATRARVGRLPVTPRLLDDESVYREFRMAEDELSVALSALWPMVRASPAPGADLLIEDFEPGLDRSLMLLAESLLDLDRRIADYRAATGRFPGSLLTGIAAFGGREPLAGP